MNYGQLRKRGKYYHVSAYDPAKRRTSWISTKCTNRTDAREWVRTREHEQALGIRALKRATLADVVAGWISEKRLRVSDSYLENLELTSSLWLGYLGHKRNVGDVRRQDLESYLADRASARVGKEARKLSASTLNNDLAALRNLFRYAIERGYVTANPAAGIERFPGEIKKRTRYISELEERRLLDACRLEYLAPAKRRKRRPGTEWTQTFRPPEYLYPLVLAALRSGLRRRTLLSLEWEHVDVAAAMWRIPAEIMKTREAYQQPIPRSVLDAIESLPRKNRYVFGLGPNVDIKRAFGSAVERAGLSGMTFHDCRRVFLNRLREKGVSVEVAMELTGHKSIATVMKHYREVPMSDTRDAVNLLSLDASSLGDPSVDHSAEPCDSRSSKSANHS